MNRIVRVFALCMITAFCSLITKGQENRYVDSLKAALEEAVHDTAKADILFALSDYTASDSASGVYYARQAFHLKLNRFHLAKAHFYLALALFDYDYDDAIREFMLSDSLFSVFERQDAYLLRSRAWSNIAALYQRKSDNEKFVDYVLNKAIPLAAKAADSSRVARSYLLLALPFMNFGDYNRAMAYLEKSISIFSRWDAGSFDLADAYVYLAKNYVLGQDTEKAKPLLDSAWNILSREPLSYYVPVYYTVLAQYYAKIKDYQSAEQNINKGLEIAVSNNYVYDIRGLLYGKVAIFEQQHEYGKAIDILKKLLDERHIAVLSDKVTVYKDLSVLESKRGNPQAALTWLTGYVELKDSLDNSETKLKIADLELKYNYSEKEKELLVAQNKASLQQVYTTASLLGFTLAVLIFAYYIKQRKIKTEQQLKSMEQQQKIEVTRALLQGEEKERSRLAKELHDGMGGLLANIRMQMEDVLEENALGQKENLIKKMDNSVHELRRIARNMMPESLLRSGLTSAITDLCQSFSSERLQVEHQLMNIEKAIPQQEQLIIYRIVQELMTNALKHAKATEVFVQCSQAEDRFYITVEDNGVGFDKGQMNEKRKGIGFENIRSRVEFLNGQFEVVSGLNKGTIINIDLYVSKNA